ERVGAVVRFRSGKTRRSFVAGQLPAPERARVAVERRPSVARVLSTLREEPGAPLARLASRTGLTAGAVCRILRDLVEGGAVTAAREGRRVHYRAVDPRPGPETGLASPRRQ
ncbi:MAG: helix-turn-helix domain-containing protein, partial [Methanobacteriota archaeon]